ncbi:hypothetical protein I350_00268 [Cryptococcus amylolentus CBS 6273]|nr:hypothetical protein I350_00268 [Cryptococcus amylolentus CBS 6273]
MSLALSFCIDTPLVAMKDDIELEPLGASKPQPPPRHPAAEGSLHAAYKSAEDKAKAMIHLQEGGMDAISVWGLVIAAWFAILAIPLLLFPRILLFFSQVAPPNTPFSSSSVANHAAAAAARENHYDTLTSLESTLCLTLSFGLLAVALISVFLLVPTYDPEVVTPGRGVLVGILTGLMTILGWVLWNARGLGALGTLLGGGNWFVALWGWWVLIFGEGRSEMMRGHKHKTPKRLKKL